MFVEFSTKILHHLNITTCHTRISQFVWICNLAAFVPLNENICQHDTPTEPRGVKKINGVNVKKALVPWYAMGGITMAWHFNAFSEQR